MAMRTDGIQKNKEINSSQSLSWQVRGDRKKWIDAKVFFFGQAWKDFAQLMASRSMLVHNLSYFVGATINGDKKTIVIRGEFAFEQWMSRYARKFPDWTFSVKPGRIRIPFISQDDDTLVYSFGEIDAAEFWDENFVSASNESADNIESNAA